MAVTASHIRIWQLSRNTAADPEPLVLVLREAANWSLANRLTVFPLLRPLLQHSHPEVRAAAVSALSGATGPLAWKWITDRLQDDSVDVRRAAVSAMAVSASGNLEDPHSGDSARMAHAVFHPDSEVRKAVIDLPFPFRDEAHWCGLLIADPACNRAAILRMQGHRVADAAVITGIRLHESTLMTDGDLLALLVAYFGGCRMSELLSDCLLFGLNHSIISHADLLAANWAPKLTNAACVSDRLRHDIAAVWLYQQILRLSEDSVAARELLSQLIQAFGPGTLAQFLLRSESKTRRNFEHILQTARSKQGLNNLHGAPPHDVIDDLLDVVWPTLGESGAATEPVREAAENTSQDVFARVELTEPEGHRFAAAVLWAAHRHGWYLRPALLAAARHYPEVLALPTLPPDVREYLVLNLAQDTGYRPSFKRTRLTSLLLPVAMPDGADRLDLTAAAAVLTFFRDARFEKAVGKLKIDRIIEAVSRDVDRAFPLFCLSDPDGYVCRDQILDRLRKQNSNVTSSTRGIFGDGTLGLIPPTDFERLIARINLSPELSDLTLIETLTETALVRIFQEMRLLVAGEHQLAEPVINRVIAISRTLASRAGQTTLNLVLSIVSLQDDGGEGQLDDCFLCGLVEVAPLKMLSAALEAQRRPHRDSLVNHVLSRMGEFGGRATHWKQFPIARRIKLSHELPLPVDSARRQFWVGHSQLKAAEAGLSEGSSNEATSSENLPLTLSEVCRSDDIDQLVQCCRASNTMAIVEAAAFRLLEIGSSASLDCILSMLHQVDVARGQVIAGTVSLMPPSLTRTWAERFMDDTRVHALLRFSAGMELTKVGQPEIVSRLIDLVCESTTTNWLTQNQLDSLLLLIPTRIDSAIRFIESDQEIAVIQAVKILTAPEFIGPASESALRKALQLRPHQMPLSVTHLLASRGMDEALLLLLEASLNGDSSFAGINEADEESLVHMVIDAVLVAGSAQISEDVAVKAVERILAAEWAYQPLQRLLSEAASISIRTTAAAKLYELNAFGKNVGRLTDILAWGANTARDLTAQQIRIRLLGNDELGVMRRGRPEIHVSPLPIIEQARHADDVVKGLIVHELGHHMYHSGEGYEPIHIAAGEEKLSRLLNVVLDEHLERNLRAVNSEYGDQLKKLNAYAFQHKVKEVSVDALLMIFGPQAFDLLTRCDLSPARTKGSVRILPGTVLRILEANGSSFARFFRALLMGLGNRYGDPKVGEALALFGPDFRNSTADQLFQITRRLRKIFGDETDMLDNLGADTLVSAEDSGLGATAAGLSDERVDDHIRRFVDGMPDPLPAVSDPGPTSQGGTNRPKVVFNLNVTPSEQFREIDRVVDLKYDADARRRYTTAIAPQIRRLRQFLYGLGFGYDSLRMRTSGRRLDPGRLMSLVVRSDPRMMKSRQLSFNNDLFLSILVDCSGSMSGKEIEIARSFATLMADACLGLRGIDVRVFGFTDKVIYDAGDARHCAAHALVANGGNNDAAGLAHAANVALRSKRRAKALVMISDGLPTDCSVDALRGLVRQLTYRHGIVCAQVATCDLKEICFPNYVVLKNSGLAEAVGEFGAILRQLIIKALK